MVSVKPLARGAEVREFLLKGKVIDLLLIAIVIGSSLTAVVKAFVTDILTPLIAASFRYPNFGALHFTVNKSELWYGDFLNQLITFLLVILTVYFLLVMPTTSRAVAFWKGNPKQKCPFCKSSIPMGVSKCAFCCSELPEAPTGHKESVIHYVAGQPAQSNSSRPVAAEKV